MFGTRGVMPKETKACLKQMGISRVGILKSISLIALRSSVAMYHQFMDNKDFFPPDLVPR